MVAIVSDLGECLATNQQEPVNARKILWEKNATSASQIGSVIIQFYQQNTQNIVSKVTVTQKLINSHIQVQLSIV